MSELKRLLTKVAIIRSNKDNYEIYTIDEIIDLGLKLNNSDNCRFLKIGDEIMLENQKYKVNNIVFRLDPILTGMYSGLDLYSQQPDESNCQLSVFVQPE